jgi:dTDP-4-dehydrorhamnose 3,5-epimerase-like enzyme
MKKDINLTNSNNLLIELPCHIDDGNELIVLEGSNVIPFAISRVFFVRAKKGSVRGKHAHKICSQFMVCITGSIEILCDDGVNKKTYLLNNPSIGLNVKPGVWAQQKYLQEDSVLAVMCNRPFEQEDYIYDYEKFKIFIK